MCLQRARNAIHRSEHKVRLLFDLDDGKIRFEDLVLRVRQIDDAHQQDRDTSTTEIKALWPYCEIELLEAAGEHMSKGGLAVVGGSEVTDEQTANEFAKSTIGLVLGQRLHVTALQRLRQRIFVALETKGADTGADTEAFLAETAPRNDDIAVLYLKIIREKQPGMSEKQIALDFTDGDKVRANSLLRGVRRYRNRLSHD